MIYHDEHGRREERAATGVMLGRQVEWTYVRDVGWTISILCADHGHFGSDWYVYCDAPTPPTGDGYVCSLGRSIAPHWWTQTCSD